MAQPAARDPQLVDLVSALIEATHAAVVGHAEELTALDRAIGDGDHGLNMRRGFDALLAARAEIAALPFAAALARAGATLVMTVGGASGPLYGSMLMAMGGAAADRAPVSVEELAAIVGVGFAAVKARGKLDVGAKTLLDVLGPVRDALDRAHAQAEPAAVIRAVRAAADAGLAATREMRAVKGRAAYVGERAIGHLDPGARSAQLLAHAVCDVLAGLKPAPSANVALVIVSQSPDVARGAAEMVRQMAGERVRVAACGGAADGALGADVGAIMRAIDSVWSASGVAVLVDLGGSESSSEMAIELLGPERAARVALCDAPLVEGAVMAAAAAAGGAPLEEVRATAEAFRA